MHDGPVLNLELVAEDVRVDQLFHVNALLEQ